ncbi:MAG: SUMF1/EgtB/PvdO family nonheme iron enzyme [Pseudomonadota bacterium]
MYRTLVRLLIALLVLASPAAASDRLALVIGNADYRVGPLANPGSDARLISDALRETGFEVALLLNADRRSLLGGVRDFAAKLEALGPDTVAVFYYAGHGVQVSGRNFLIPIGARIESEADLDFEGLDAQWVLSRIGETGVNLSLFILDACRNNPFPAASRSGARGLARMDAPRGSLLSYSTAPGDVALDGDGANSPYSAALATAIRTPGLKVEDVFKATRRSVVEKTGGRQTPWESSSLIGDFFFRPGTAAPQPALAQPAIRPGEIFRDCPDCPEMAALGGGPATIGSASGSNGHDPHEAPKTRVTLAPYALMRTEVTRGDYARFLSETGHQAASGCWWIYGVWLFDKARNWRETGYDQSDDHPVACIRWSDAVAYAEWMSARTGHRYRLPTEAEWEAAAAPPPWGADGAAACGYGNLHDETANATWSSGAAISLMPCDDGAAGTARAGSYRPTANGLFDMFGNLGEWTADCWSASHAGRPASGAARLDGDCDIRVSKGGSFLSPAHGFRPAFRFPSIAKDPNVYLGFRLARDLR